MSTAEPFTVEKARALKLAEYMAQLRKDLLVPTDFCVGCWIGDADASMHDYEYGCDYGKGAAWDACELVTQ